MIIVSHSLIYALLYRQNPSRFQSSESSTEDEGRDREKEEEKNEDTQKATLSLLGCSDLKGLVLAVGDGIKTYLPQAISCLLLFYDEETKKVFTFDCTGEKILLSSIHNLWEVGQSKEPVRTVLKNVDPDIRVLLRKDSDVSQATSGKYYVSCIGYRHKVPRVTLLKSISFDIQLHCTSKPDSYLCGVLPLGTLRVLCSPVLDVEQKNVVAVLMVVGEVPQQSLKKLSWYQKQIAACYSHIQRTFSPNRGDDEKASQQLIRLCGELYDQDAGKLQLKVIKYLEEQTQAECAFILLVVPDTQELFCQVIGKKVLEEEVRFPGQSSSFAAALETKQPFHLDDIPQENLQSMEEMAERTIQSFLCVPVTSRSDNNLIALACLVNKTNANRFTDRDISCIQQCFRYTATVLTSTIAFQNERRLKIQTQALLQVARHLFTNLGELNKTHYRGLDNFPWIRSRMCEMNVYGSTTAKREKYVVLCNSNLVDDHVEWKHPFRCRADVDDKMVYFPKSLKEIAKEKLNVNISNGANSKKDNVDKLPKSLKEIAKENVKVNLSNGTDAKKENVDKLPIIKSLKEIAKETLAANISHGTELNKEYVDEIINGLCRNCLKNVCQINTEVKTQNNDLDYLCKVEVSEDLDTYSGSDSLEEQDTLLDTEGNHSIMAQLSPHTSAMSDSTISCNSYHTANSVETEVSEDLDEDTDLEETFFDAWDILNTPKFFRRLSDSLCTRKDDSRSSVGFTPSSYHDTSSHEIYVEDADTGLGHAVLSSTQFDVAHSVSLDELLHTVSPSENNSLNGSKHVENPTSNLDGKKNESLKRLKSSTQNKEDEVVTTLSAVDIIDLQCPETEISPPCQNDLTKLLREIMQQARNLTHAERCSVFLIDKETDELVAKVFDGIQTNKNNELTEIRMPGTQGIAGHVATSGELLNIKDAYSHPLFYRGIDDTTGFKTRNILCFPIKDGKGTILGVAQLCNKKTGPCFSTFDEDVATAFGIYCCISINHCLMYRKLQDSQHRKSLVNEIMIYHMQVSANDVQSLMTVDIPHPRLIDANFLQFTYAPRLLPEDRTMLSTLSMFEDLGFISHWRIKRETLARFVLMVKKGYRNPPYHNWMHAYTVGQFCYQLINNLKLEKYLDDVELFALFISCLCHDIDHRGTTNAFQLSSKSVLAALYSSQGSVLERHHFAQTMCILNTEGCNIYENLDSKDYQQVLDLMREIILATDLQHHFDILTALTSMAEKGYDRSNVRNRKLLLCLLMTSCDLADQTRPWENAKGVAALIYKEFFSEGDMEKAQGKRPPSSFDRERVEIPTHQISFIDKVAMPVYKLLADIFPAAQELVDAVEDNKAHWEKISNLIKLKKGGSCAKMTFDEVLAIEHQQVDEGEINHNELNSENGQDVKS